MLQRAKHTTLFVTIAGLTVVQATRLSWSLFLEYMSSPTFGGDVADALCHYESLSSLFQSGFKVSQLVEQYSRVLGARLVYRLTECAVSAACAFSPSSFFQGAVVFHYLYPTVQEYRFGRCWVTRLLRLLSSWVVPRFLRPALLDATEDPDGAYLQRPPPPTPVPHTGRSSSSPSPSTMVPGMASGAKRVAAIVGSTGSHTGTSSRAAGMGASDKEAAFYAREEAVFEAMPDVCAATLRYYVYSYKAATFKTVVQAAFIPDFARFLVELGQWSVIFAEERTKATSRWRVLKRFIADQVATVTQLCLCYTVRYVGATIGLRVFGEPTGGSIFWTEHMLHFLFAFQILFVGLYVRTSVVTALDCKFPATPDDLEEDRREQKEAEESAARADAWTRMASETLDSAGGGNSSGGSTGGRRGGPFANASGTTGAIVDFYSVLQVSDRAEQTEIKKAYRKLALMNHPDRVGREAQAQRTARERMSVINEAYDTLMDSHKKAQYDARRRMATAPSIVEKLETMSTPKLAGLTAGLLSLLCVAGYAHFVATFQRVTACGAGPLGLFGGL